MSRVARLEADLATARAKADAQATAFREFRAHLANSRFAGIDPNTAGTLPLRVERHPA